jgi:hypothetical protein
MRGIRCLDKLIDELAEAGKLRRSCGSELRNPSLEEVMSCPSHTSIQ